jgi:hypothetical protein
MEDYNSALEGKPHLRPFLGEPYGACLQWVLTTILRRKAEDDNRERIDFFHEQNSFSAEAVAVHHYVGEKWDIGEKSSLKFSSKGSYVPLQAADIFAYESNKRLRDRVRPTRRALDALVPDKQRARLRYFNRENMPELIMALERAVAAEAGRPASRCPEAGGENE